jgi:predicted small integral membrane protein
MSMLVRVAKIAMTASIAAVVSVVAFGNITDYGNNLRFVQHVMSMDSLFPTTTITYRAISNPVLQHAAYALIIAAETATAVICWVGSFRLIRRLRADARTFNRAKDFGIAGLTLGFLLFQFGFVTIGGEWFGMWMSLQWNGVPSAFRYLMTIIAVLIFVAMPDEDLSAVRP